MPRLTVRPAEPSELARAGEITLAAYAAAGLTGDDGYLVALGDAVSRAQQAVLLVALDGEEVVGTVTFVPDGGPLGEIADAGEAEFRMLAVDPAARGRGVGGAILEYLVGAASTLGFDRLVCSSEPEMTTAHHLFERHGFARAPARDWSPAPGVDLVVFEHALVRAPSTP